MTEEKDKVVTDDQSELTSDPDPSEATAEAPANADAETASDVASVDESDADAEESTSDADDATAPDVVDEGDSSDGDASDEDGSENEDDIETLVGAAGAAAASVVDVVTSKATSKALYNAAGITAPGEGNVLAKVDDGGPGHDLPTEPDDDAAGGTLMVLIVGLTVFLFVCTVLLFQLYKLVGQTELNNSVGPAISQDLAELRAANAGRIEGEGVVDSEANIYRVPVTMGIDALLENPSWLSAHPNPVSE